MTATHLIYFSDPMCSWCWGFSPVIEAIEEVWGDELPIRLVMGGLRPGPHEAMSDEARLELRSHWRHVTEASGQPFGPLALSHSGFVYDTDPAARAVVVVRRNAPDKALAFLRRLHRAFYVEGLDITDAGQLCELAAEIDLDRGAFGADLQSQETRQETWRDYAIAQRGGVRGFPTLIIGPRGDGAFSMVTRGFQPAAVVLPSIARELEALSPA
ncbi:MAG TPA: DsbA family protein [Caulobacteraceae bacterium]|jgi:putative protein-disulfide isomerase|nr:DsbA family protein [Caulobacteraceae bacterium]